MGLISLIWVFCHNLVKIHLVTIEILSFSRTVLFFVTADLDHLAIPNCKKIKMAKCKDYYNRKLVKFH